MCLKLSEGMIVYPNKDHNGPFRHPYIVLSVPHAPYKAQEFVQCMGISSLTGKERTTELPILINNRKSYVLTYAIHSFSYDELEDIEAFGTPEFISWLSFKGLLLSQYNCYLLGLDKEEERRKYIRMFEKYYGDKETYTPKYNLKSSDHDEHPDEKKYSSRREKALRKKEENDQPMNLLVSSVAKETDQLQGLTQLFKAKGITPSAINRWDKHMVYTFLQTYQSYTPKILARKLGMKKSYLYQIALHARKRADELKIPVNGDIKK